MWLDDRPFNSSIFSRGHSSHLPPRRSRPLSTGRDARNFITDTVPWSRAFHRSGLSMYIRDADSSPARDCGALGDGGKGRQDLGSLSGVSHSTCFPPCRFFLSFSFRVLDPWSIFFHFLTCFFLTTTSTVSYIRRLLLSCATSPLYHPLCRSVYICRSIARIRLFINYGTSLLLSIHVSNLVLRCRAAPLHHIMWVN